MEEKIKNQASIAWENYLVAIKGKPDSDQKRIFCELFRLGLKFQDRDTRHKCAEAVEQVANKEIPGICKTQEACAACINVQAV